MDEFVRRGQEIIDAKSAQQAVARGAGQSEANTARSDMPETDENVARAQSMPSAIDPDVEHARVASSLLGSIGHRLGLR